MEEDYKQTLKDIARQLIHIDFQDLNKAEKNIINILHIKNVLIDSMDEIYPYRINPEF